LEGDSL